MDELASMLGCKPNPFLYLITDPILAYRLLFGPNAPYVYRIKGPHAWDGARDALLSLDERVLHGMRGVSKKKSLNNSYENVCSDDEKKKAIKPFLHANTKSLILLLFLILSVWSFIKLF